MNIPKSTTNDPNFLARATDSDSLETRLAVNDAYSQRDFQQWLLDHLKIRGSVDVLDIGCGSGAQSIAISRCLDGGTLTCIDISAASVERVRAGVAHPERVHAIVADMDRLADVLSADKCFDIAYSVYALYYAKDPWRVMAIMLKALKPKGRLAVAGPMTPNGMVEIIRRFHLIPEKVDLSLSFGQRVVEPFFRTHFGTFSIHYLRNPQTIRSAEEFIAYYQSTTYFSAEHLKVVERFAQDEVSKNGGISFDKNTFLAIGFRD